jgi:hypothetical protein
MRERPQIYLSREGEDFEFTPSGGSARIIRGIFLNEYEPSYTAGIEHQNIGPRIMCLDEDAEDVAQGSTFLRLSMSVTYRVIEVRPDGTGWTELLLTKV